MTSSELRAFLLKIEIDTGKDMEICAWNSDGDKSLVNSLWHEKKGANKITLDYHESECYTTDDADCVVIYPEPDEDELRSSEDYENIADV